MSWISFYAYIYNVGIYAQRIPPNKSHFIKVCQQNMSIINLYFAFYEIKAVHLLTKTDRFEILSWASCQIRKIAGCAFAGNAGNVFPHHWLQRKTLVSDPGMHHGTCVTHVPWCMSESPVTDGGENVPGIPGACAPAIFRIWQEAHGNITNSLRKTSYR